MVVTQPSTLHTRRVRGAAITLGEASVSSRVGGSAEVEGDVSLVRTLLDLDFFLIMEKGLSAIVHKNVNLAGWSTEIV